jgi:hypothetical protein
MAMFITQANLAFRLHPKKDAGPSGWLPTPSLSGTASMRAMRVSGPDQKHLRHTRCGSKFGRAKPVSAYLTAQSREEGRATLAGKSEACLEQTTMGRIFGVPLAPKKGRWPKSKKKRALLRYQLKAAGEYKKTLRRWCDGSSGAASPVRRIDPVTGEITEVINTKTGILQRKGARR